MQPKSTSKIKFLGFLFYFLIAALAIFAKTPAAPAFQNHIWVELLAGKAPFKPIGAQFSVFKQFLPPNENITFIMDFPFSSYLPKIEQLYSAQSYLTPSILTYEPTSKAAIIYCSSTPTALQRMAQTGYRILLPLAECKGIAVKK